MGHFISTWLQWGLYFLPSIVAWLRLRSGKTITLAMWYFIFLNLVFAWTGVVWILLMLLALGYNPIPWVVVRLVKILPKAGGVPMNTAQAQGAASGPGPACSQCGGSGTMPCSHCQARGSRYTQPTTANEVAQLQSCSYCIGSGRIRCPYCGDAHG